MVAAHVFPKVSEDLEQGAYSGFVPVLQATVHHHVQGDTCICSLIDVSTCNTTGKPGNNQPEPF